MNQEREIEIKKASEFNQNNINLNSILNNSSNNIINNKNSNIQNEIQKYSIWTKSEDQKLKEIIEEKGDKNWEKISGFFENKSARQCKYRWYKFINPQFKYENWTEEEDEILINFVMKYGTKNWTILSKLMNSRKTPKLLKERWYNVLSLKLTSEKYFSPKEDLAILLMVNKFGTCWSKIISKFPDKNENQIKNRCYSLLRNYAIEFIKNNYPENKTKSNELKVNEMIIFIKLAIENLRKILGEEIYQNISEKYLNEYNSTCPCKDIKINLCEICKRKLKENLKKTILMRIIQNRIKGNKIQKNDLNLSSLLQNNNINNTIGKIESVKELLTNFIKNIV